MQTVTPAGGVRAATSGARVRAVLARPGALLAVAALVHAALALLTVGLDRPLRWDEVTYLAQVTPGADDVFFGPQRARGMTLVVAPVALLGAPLTLLRAWMIAVSAAGLVLAYRPWTRVAGRAGAAAALVTAVGWVPLYFSVEVYPNLPAAFATTAAVGHLVAWLVGRRRGDLVGVAVAVAAVALLRPSESVWLGAAAGVLALVWARRDALRPLAALAVGGVVGALPWIVEAVVRYGGPFAQLAAARAESVSGTPRNNLIQYLNLVEGPVQDVVADPVLTYRALALLVGLAALAAIGIGQRAHRRRRQAATVGLLAGAAMTAPYLVLNAGVNLRYILPALLLGAVPIGAGAATLAGAARRHWPARARTVLVAVAVLVVGWQATLAAGNHAEIVDFQSRPIATAEALREVVGEGPCAFVSVAQWPEIQWHSGCLGADLWRDGATLQCPGGVRDMAALAADGYEVVAIDRVDPPPGSPLADWEATPAPAVEPGGWRIWQRPDDLGPGDPPTPADPAQAPAPCPPSRAPDTSDAHLRLRWDQPDR